MKKKALTLNEVKRRMARALNTAQCRYENSMSYELSKRDIRRAERDTWRKAVAFISRVDDLKSELVMEMKSDSDSPV